jgi:hypothetical protein
MTWVIVIFDTAGEVLPAGEAACSALLGLDMPDVVYQTVDGLRVTLTERRWLMHILPRHAEVTEADVA